jgi:ribosomal-protein-alanine N-acetyltransferase
MELQTERLRLVAASAPLTRLAVEDRAAWAAALGATVPPSWPYELLVDAEPWIAAKMEAVTDAELGWWMWYAIRSGELIGTAGLKGPPDANGVVEIGYGLVPEEEGRGYGTEAARAVFDWAARDPRVKRIVAETFPSLPRSVRVMEKLGMTLEGPGSEEGTIRYGVSIR